jgi:hypothetical protein
VARPGSAIPAGDPFEFSQETGGQQSVVQLIGALDLGPGFVPNPLDRCRIQSSKIVGRRRLEGSASVNRLRPPFLQRRVIQEGIGSGIQDLMRQWRGLRQIPGHQPQLTRPDLAEDFSQPPEIHDVVHTVIDRLADQRVIGNLPVSRNVLQTGGCVRERGSQEIFGLHPLYLGRHLTPAPTARNGERDIAVPPPVGAEHGRVEQCLYQDLLDGLGVEEAKHALQRERVLRPERKQDRILCGRGLQLEVELATESLPERQTPGAIHPAAEGSVDDELHPPSLVEESLGDDSPLSRQVSEETLGLREILDELMSGNAGGDRERSFAPLRMTLQD